MDARNRGVGQLEPWSQFHEKALIVDGLVFTSDGDASVLRAGNLSAANVTVSGLTAGFEEAFDALATWHARLAEKGSGWLLVKTTEDILQAQREGRVGLIMGWQSMDPIGANLSRIRLFHMLGLRIMQPAYNEANLLADGCLEPRDGGLTALGREAVREMNRVGIGIDLSHLGERACLDIAALSERPVLLTHANAKAVVDVPRNKSDDVIRAVAGTGGLIGISVYGPMCWSGDTSRRPDLSDFLRHLDHVVGLVGKDRVALGTDFPGLADVSRAGDIIAWTLARFPGNIAKYAAAFGNDIRTRYLRDCGRPAELPALTDALGRHGWSEADISNFLGGNYVRVLDQIWGKPVQP